MVDKCALIPAIALACLIGGGRPAHADAFLEQPGSGKIIVTGGFEESSRTIGVDGASQPVAAYRKFTLQARTEYGLSERLTLIGGIESGSGRTTDQGAQAVGPVQIAGAMGARALMFRSESITLSSFSLVKAGAGLDAVLYGTQGATADTRLEIGKTFKALGADAFATLSAGALVATGGGRDRRLDATLGARVRDDLLVLIQVFSRFTDRPVLIQQAHNRASRLASQHGWSQKAQASVVWDVLANWSVQAGAFATLLARNERMQRGLFAALWRRF